MSYRKHLMTSDEPPSELYKAVELDTNLAEVGTDCISRHAAIDAVYKCSDIFVGDMPVMVVKADAYEALAQLPSAQPERKMGKWIRHDEIKNVYGGIYIECSECGEKYVVQHILDEKYCRNCGAMMRGEQK